VPKVDQFKKPDYSLNKNQTTGTVINYIHLR